jgi:hypothetical protein
MLKGFQLLQKFLEKRGLGTINELSQEEKQTYEHWSGVLGKTLSVDDIKRFLQGEIARLRELREKDEKDPLDDIHRAQVANYKQLLSIIAAPERDKLKLEKELRAMIGEDEGEKET